jgi:hypothetical protein
MAYREQFKDNNCAFAEPGNRIMVINPENGKTYISPFEESESDFMGRIERSKQECRNLFFEEWEEDVLIPGVLY